MMRKDCLLGLSIVFMQILGCLANVEQLVQVFNAAIDSLAPPDKAMKLKADMEKARPCLDNLVAELGEGTLDQVLRGIVPLAMKCGTMLMGSQGDMESRKKIFSKCAHAESDEFISSLPKNEQSAFKTAKNCVKDLIEDFS
ncbi:uncharacterized protein LOC100909149 [Galendromus occidentalis]|uniref:Uncharacterized protein LOC100909149 n=1 Tax=Galendromus occidentalis TaxID=34638 RepID=A0AAJ6QPN2_9ACAR|nr:uncharacterized protein LOC100909149 [Galendromus occidentalis]